jgi:hypothetical protein
MSGIRCRDIKASAILLRNVFAVGAALVPGPRLPVGEEEEEEEGSPRQQKLLLANWKVPCPV